LNIKKLPIYDFEFVAEEYEKVWGRKFIDYYLDKKVPPV